MLLNKGAKVDIADNRGRTPLHLAAQNNNKEIVDVLIKAGANVNAMDENKKTPLDLTTDEEIKALLQNAEKTDPVDESSTDSKGDQEEDAGTKKKEKQVAEAQPGSDIIGQDSDNTEPQSDNSKEAVAPTQTEEQPSSFFGSLFRLLMKPFSLIASFFGGFFSWLFGSDEPIQSSSESDQTVVSELPSDSGENNII